MSGIYVHIPFCRKACHYCNFHFSTRLALLDRTVKAIAEEASLRRDYLAGQPVHTIYFGGGTPSVLSAAQLEFLMDAFGKYFSVSGDVELTLEANPDDLSSAYIAELSAVGINRLSIGVQSFFDDELKWMNRSHNASQAEACLTAAQEAGFTNITADLIFGTPAGSTSRWIQNLDRLSSFDIPHISCYGLTVEPRTALKKMIETGESKAPDEGQYAEQFALTRDYLSGKGYERYEISNYARDGQYSRHNTAYWQGKAYLGLGPSAHSFDGNSRQWNQSNNPLYLKAVEAGDPVFEKENLGAAELFNEYLLTGLRTKWGCSLERLRGMAGGAYTEFEAAVRAQETQGLVIRDEGTITLSDAGLVMANTVIAELFVE